MEKKIKIIYILPSLEVGGAERFNLDLIKYLNPNEFNLKIILFKSKGHWFNELQKNKNIQCFVLAKKSKIDLKNIFQIYNLIKKESPDIVHTQLGGDLRGRLAAILARVKIIISTEQNINKKENFLYSLLKSLISLFSTEVISISEAVKKNSKKRYFLSAHKYKSIIHNGFDLNRFPYLKNKKINTIKKVGTVSRLVKQKGIDILIKSWAGANINDSRLIIGGDGPEKENLKTLVTKYNLSERVSFLGQIDDVSSFYQSLDLFVMPSRWEGLGITALEAAASGTPLLISSIDGLKEIFDENSVWFIKNLDKLDLDLKESLNNLEKESDYKRQRAYRNVINKFSIHHIARQYENIYKHYFKSQLS